MHVSRQHKPRTWAPVSSNNVHMTLLRFLPLCPMYASAHVSSSVTHQVDT